MQKPNNYDTTQAAGEFEPIKLGGHKMIIKQVSERQSKPDNEGKTVISDKAVDGCQLYKSLCTIRDKYGVRFEFCTKEETGRRIVELLT